LTEKKWDINKNVIYIYTNKINGKKYCGITCRPLRVRSGFKGRNYVNSNPTSKFARAITKYGWDSFTVSILYHDLTRSQACNIECQVIRELSLLDDRYGYNITTGGDDNVTSDKSIHYGKDNGMYGKGYKLSYGKNGRARQTKLILQDGTTKYFDTQKECREYINVGKDLFRSIRDYGKPFEFSIMTNKSKIREKLIGIQIIVE